MLSSRKAKSVFLVSLAFWVNFSTTGGIIYGLSSLFELMDKELGGLGQFHEECKDPPLDCTWKDNMYSNMFTIALGFVSLGSAVIGILMDYLGPKFAALFGLFLFSAGNWLVATTDSSKDEVNVSVAKFITGLSLIAMGGMGPYMSSFSIANVTKFPNTITSIIAAIFNFAGLTYFLVWIILDELKMSVENQRKFFGLLLTLTSVGQAVLIYLFWPVRAFAPNSDVERLVDFRLFKPTEINDDAFHGSSGFKNQDILLQNSSRQNNSPSSVDSTSSENQDTFSFSDVKGYIVSGNKEHVPLCKAKAKVQLFSKEFMLGTAFFSLCILAMSFYLGTIFVQMDGKADWLGTNLLLQANATPFVLAWPCGLLLDRFGFSFGVFVLSGSSFGMFSTILLDSIPWYVVSSVFFALFRCFLFATYFGYVGMTFGFTNFGVLVGSTTIFSFVVGQLGILLNSIAYNYGFWYVNAGLAVVTGLLLYYLALTLSSWERDGKVDHMTAEDSDHSQIEDKQQSSVKPQTTVMLTEI